MHYSGQQPVLLYHATIIQHPQPEFRTVDRAHSVFRWRSASCSFDFTYLPLIYSDKSKKCAGLDEAQVLPRDNVFYFTNPPPALLLLLQPAHAAVDSVLLRTQDLSRTRTRNARLKMYFSGQTAHVLYELQPFLCVVSWSRSRSSVTEVQTAGSSCKHEAKREIITVEDFYF